MMVITSLHDMDLSIWQTNRIYLCEGVEVNFRDLPACGNLGNVAEGI